jgi:hypothetical protein
METIRKLAKSTDRPMRMPVDDKPGAPEKHDGPQHGTFSKDEIHAAGLLHAPPGDGTASERARKMAALQQRMGNARLSRLLRETGVAPVHEAEPSEVAKRQ